MNVTLCTQLTLPRLMNPYLLASSSAACLPPEVICTAQLLVMVAVAQLVEKAVSSTTATNICDLHSI